MKYKILVALGVLGALGYVFREKVVQAVNAVLDKVDAMVMVDDPTEDPPADRDDPVYGTLADPR